MNFILTFLLPRLKGFLPTILKTLPWVMTILVIWFGGFFYSKSYWQSPLLKQIEAYQKAERKLTNDLDDIKKKAESDAKDAQSKLQDKQKNLDDIQQKYILEKNKSPKIVYVVKDPRPNKGDITLEFDKKDNLICNKFSDSYVDTLNKMIDEANK
ncbi:MAG TPA: hypothetical protein VFM18_13870 [Methanosarcina sp.]|nr:hypothetical protein [Methanosarcina sp.]